VYDKHNNATLTQIYRLLANLYKVRTRLSDSIRAMHLSS